MISQILFIDIVLYTIQLVSKQLLSNTQENKSVNVVKFINYKTNVYFSGKASLQKTIVLLFSSVLIQFNNHVDVAKLLS